jgi:hypothetical protein
MQMGGRVEDDANCRLGRRLTLANDHSSLPSCLCPVNPPQRITVTEQSRPRHITTIADTLVGEQIIRRPGFGSIK